MTTTVGFVLATVALFAAALGRLRRSQALRRLQGAFAFLGVALAVLATVEAVHVEGPWLEWAGVAVLLAIGYLLARLALLLVFDWLLAQRVGVEVPRLARDVAALILYLLVAATVLRSALDMEVGALLATSAVLTAVVGLALQETLGTLLAGLALAWEKRIARGEWVEVDGVTGRVEELGWRTLALQTRLGHRVLLPNSTVARSRVKLLGHGEQPVAVVVRLGVSYAVPSHLVKPVIEAACRDLPGVLSEPPAQVLVHEFADSAVIYELRLWTLESWREADVRDAALTRLHAALGRAGMEIPFPQRTVHVIQPPSAAGVERRSERALAECEIFAGLPADALASLARRSRWLAFAPGEAVVHEGEQSQALFVVASGVAVVTRGGQELSRITVGDVFGEMALLLGEPRAATVRALAPLEVVEVDSAALRALLQEHAGIAEELARRVAERQRALAERDAIRVEKQTPRGFAAVLLERLQRLMTG